MWLTLCETFNNCCKIDEHPLAESRFFCIIKCGTAGGITGHQLNDIVAEQKSRLRSVWTWPSYRCPAVVIDWHRLTDYKWPIYILAMLAAVNEFERVQSGTALRKVWMANFEFQSLEAKFVNNLESSILVNSKCDCRDATFEILKSRKSFKKVMKSLEDLKITRTSRSNCVNPIISAVISLWIGKSDMEQSESRSLRC